MEHQHDQMMSAGHCEMAVVDDGSGCDDIGGRTKRNRRRNIRVGHRRHRGLGGKRVPHLQRQRVVRRAGNLSICARGDDCEMSTRNEKRSRVHLYGTQYL